MALMLASRLPTISLKNIQITAESLSMFMIISAAIIILAVIYPWYSLPVAAVLYVISIPICSYYSRKAEH